MVVAALLAYHNSFSGPFVFDDTGSVTDNSTIRHFGSALFPPAASTMSGRPLVNLTFALNYTFGGTEVWGYHAFNLLIHSLAGLTFFGVLRRTFLRPSFSEHFRAQALPLALTIAAIWTVHPLQTEAVTYVSQRAESLMGLCYFFTIYAFIRGVDSPNKWHWHVVSVAACLLGMASKEVMVSAPLLVLLYDRTFVARTFQKALGKSPWLYVGLACTWILLGFLVLNTGDRSGTAGFNTMITPWTYLLTQCHAITHYLQLAVWPSPLVFDYGSDVVQSIVDVVLPASFLLAMGFGTVIALRFWPMAGIVGAWFFAILAPSSSVVAVATQTMAEHRFYLPLAAVISSIVIGLFVWLGRRSLFVFAAAAVGLIWLTVCRNDDYRSEVSIWSDTVAKYPGNARAQNNLGVILGNIPARAKEAVARFETALRLRPDYAAAHNNLGIVLWKIPGRSKEAIQHYEAALRYKTDYAEAHNNLGLALADIPGHTDEAIAHYEAALRINPSYDEAHNNLGAVLAGLPGRTNEAISHYEAALRIKPEDAEAHNNLGAVLAEIPGRSGEAIAHCEAALRIRPGYAEAHNNLGLALVNQPSRLNEAIAHYEAALRINPGYAKAHNNLGLALADIPGRADEAIAHYEAALRIKPDFAKAHNNLGIVLANTPGRFPEAKAHFEAALQIDPNYAKAHNNLAKILAESPEQTNEAIAHFEAALRSKPDFAEAHNSLGIVLANTPGRLTDAKVHFEAALRINPEFTMAQQNLKLVNQLLAQQSGTP